MLSGWGLSILNVLSDKSPSLLAATHFPLFPTFSALKGPEFIMNEFGTKADVVESAPVKGCRKKTEK